MRRLECPEHGHARYIWVLDDPKPRCGAGEPSCGRKLVLVEYEKK